MKNIIFDLGNVLIEYSPDNFLNKYIKEKNRDRFKKEVFKSLEWANLDKGTIELGEAMNIFKSKFPDEKEAVDSLFGNGIDDYLIIHEKNISLLPILKEKGYKLYVLSNFHEFLFSKMKEKYDFFKYFDGKIISYVVKSIKPDKKIFEELLFKYNLKAEESLFIDDIKLNTEAAEKLNINVIHLEKQDDLDKKLKEKNIL